MLLSNSVLYHHAIQSRRKLIKNDRTSVHVPSTTADTFLVHPWLYTRTPRGHLIHRPMAGWLYAAPANQRLPLRPQDTCFLGNKGTGITNEIVFALPKLHDRIADGILCLPSFSFTRLLSASGGIRCHFVPSDTISPLQSRHFPRDNNAFNTLRDFVP